MDRSALRKNPINKSVSKEKEEITPQQNLVFASKSNCASGSDDQMKTIHSPLNLDLKMITTESNLFDENYPGRTSAKNSKSSFAKVLPSIRLNNSQINSSGSLTDTNQSFNAEAH